ncbi:MAG TPA: GIY-YIG nuclease family protein [bacterium]|nr:GIY-YIG nuclease family protein [bacterium]HPL95555.1 GIY-YIG nuclease family protein [bacterium]
MYYHYILLLANRSLYNGFSNDLKTRFFEHEKGKVKSTKNLRPVKLIYYEAFLNKNDALRREKYFKTNKGKKMTKIILREFFNQIGE